MKKMNLILTSLLLLTANGAALAQTSKQTEYRSVSQVVDGWFANMEKTVIAVAEAMPEEKYKFAPTDGEFRGVRTFAKQLKHVAAANYIFAAGMLKEEPPADAADERGPDAVRTKAEIIKYLKDSFAYLHKAAAAINDQNAVEPVKNPFGQGTAGLGGTRLGLATGAVSHISNHYGQMVEYLRMNGIIPPASQ